MAKVQVEVPPRYRGPTRGERWVEVEGDTARACIEAVEDRYPGFRELILDGQGELRHFVRIFRNDDALDRRSWNARLADGDRLRILAAAAGG